MNAADRIDVANAEKKEKLAEINLSASLKRVLATEDGKVVLWHFLSEAGVHETVLKEGLERVLYRAGRQDFGHYMEAVILAADSGAMLQMMADNAKREKSNDD